MSKDTSKTKDAPVVLESDKVKDVLNEVLSNFVQTELGNKITPFNMQGLTQVLFFKLDELSGK